VTLRFEVRLWWAQARRDLRIGERNHAHRDYEAAVFYCEQAVEKALKALLMHRTGTPAPRIHSLPELGRLVRIDPKMLPFLTDLAPHYMVSRYPDAAGVVTKDLYDGRISLRFLRGSKEVLSWCRRRLR